MNICMGQTSDPKVIISKSLTFFHFCASCSCTELRSQLIITSHPELLEVIPYCTRGYKKKAYYIDGR